MPDDPVSSDLSAVRVCIDMRLGQRNMLEAAELAINEDPDNAPTGVIEAIRLVGVGGGALETFGAILTGKKWANGRELRVLHINGESLIHQKVEMFAKQWEQFANITFSFITIGDADIRIVYTADNRSWSHVGTDALAIAAEQPTMQFGWLTLETAESEVRRVVLHEFGHALGMIHEHEHPNVKINWDEPAVYRYYAGLEPPWSEADVNRNLFSHYKEHETQFDDYDPESIMHYPVEPGLTTDGVSVGWNRDLTLTDKRFIARVYPKPIPAPSHGFPPPTAVRSTPNAPAEGTRKTCIRIDGFAQSMKKVK